MLTFVKEIRKDMTQAELNFMERTPHFLNRIATAVEHIEKSLSITFVWCVVTHSVYQGDSSVDIVPCKTKAGAQAEFANIVERWRNSGWISHREDMKEPVRGEDYFAATSEDGKDLLYINIRQEIVK